MNTENDGQNTPNGLSTNGYTNGYANGVSNGIGIGGVDRNGLALVQIPKTPLIDDHDDDNGLAMRGYDEKIDIETDDITLPTMPDTERLPRFSSLGYRLFDANGNAVLSDDERMEMKRLAEEKMGELFDILRIDRNDPNSRDTPNRLAKMWVDEIFRGRYEAPPKCTVFPNRKNVEELVISKGIGVMSVCSHHWQTISGTCAIGYIPGEYVIGLSKLTRIVDWFGRRGQIQEELGEQIAEYLTQLLKPKAVIVVIKSRHYCMIARGVNSEEDKALMITTAVRGSIVQNEAMRSEFLTLIG